MIKRFEIGKMESCESSFFLYGPNVGIIFKIITGGIPAVSYMDHSFSRRFECKHALYKKPWDPVTRTYPHQERRSADKVYPPPLPSQDLPGGWQDIERWLEDTLPLRKLRVDRVHKINILAPSGKITSRRFHDKLKKSYFQLSVSLDEPTKANVNVHFAHATNRAENHVSRWISEEWQEAIQVLNYDLEDVMVEELSEREWNLYLNQIRNLQEGRIREHA